jgi:SAM-dependent methyltransferase
MIGSSPELSNHRIQARRSSGFSVPGPFDAVFSNAVLHWIKDPQPVIANVARHLRPGGRFIAEFGGKRNINALMVAAETVLSRHGKPFEHPWYFPSIGDYAPVLERNGFEVQAAWHFDRLTTLDEGEDAMRDWIATFRADWSQHAAEMEELLRPTLYIDGRWHMDYVRLRFQAILTGLRSSSLSSALMCMAAFAPSAAATMT